MKIWKKIYSKFTTPQLCPFQKLLQTLLTFFSKLRSLNQICQIKRGFATHATIIDQFLLTKINLSKFFDCKWHLLKLVRIQTNQNILSIFI